MYRKEYKCRNCGKIIEEEIFENNNIIIPIKLVNDPDFTKKRIHYCNDKDIGILELIAVKKV